MSGLNSKMPNRYRQNRREEKRRHEVNLAERLGMVSRHIECPEDSDHWVETGKWPKGGAEDA